MEFLKEKEWGWRQRRIEEIERIHEEEKKDRLAVVREKKKRYGISRLSKEENQRLKLRTEDRMIIARAKENLWKRFREKEEVKEIVEEELNAWEDMQLEMSRRRIFQKKEILRSGGQEEKAEMIGTEETGRVGVMVRKRKVELQSQVAAVVLQGRAG